MYKQRLIIKYKIEKPPMINVRSVRSVFTKLTPHVFPSLQISRTQNEDTPPFTRPLVYSTVIKFPQQPLPFSQWLKSKQKAKKNCFPLYSNFNLASSSCPSCSLSLSPLCPRFSILPFSLVFPFPLSPPSPLRVLACSGQAA